MARAKKNTPTAFEMRILKVLWEDGPATARAVLERLEEKDGERFGYTTVLKMLQVMEKKAMVTVDRSARSHVYAPRIDEKPTLRKTVSEFVERNFDGRAEDLLVHLVRETKMDAAKLADLEAQIAELRKREKGGKDHV